MTLRVAMTVDLEQDCPPYLDTYRGAREGMPRLLDLLAREAVIATVFCTGDVARRFPDLVRAVVAAGHELGCHGDTHRSFAGMSDADARGEIGRATAELRRFAPVTAFRAPYLRLPKRFTELIRDQGYTVDSSEGAYKEIGIRVRSEGGVARVPASVTSSVLRLPAPLRRALLAPLRSPVVLFVHPWEMVDLRRAPIRWDCRFRTGDTALACLAQVIRDLRVKGATFHPLSAVFEELGTEHARDAAQQRDREAAHR